jgi:hypothetical protein
MAILLSYTLCLSVGACLGFLLRGICANAADKKGRPRTNTNVVQIVQARSGKAGRKMKSPSRGDWSLPDGRRSATKPSDAA